jgi:hypothetical protein
MKKSFGLNHRWSLIIPLPFMVLILSACTLFTVKIPGEPLSIADLNTRVLTRDFGKRFAQSVQETSDRIIGEAAGDQLVQTRALRWKLNAVAEVQSTVFQPIPMLALIDTWTFSAQMSRFFEDGGGRELFGPWQGLAAETAQHLEKEIERVGRSIIPASKFERYRKFVEESAAAMPIANLSFYRESLLSMWARFEGKNEAELMATVGTAPEVVEDFINRFEFYEKTVFKQASWAVQLYMLDSGLGEQIDKRMTSLDAASRALVASSRQATDSLQRVERRLMNLADKSPEFIDTTLTRLSADLESVAGELNTSWASTITLLDQINQQWQTTLVALSSERQAVLDAYQEERSVLMQELDRKIDRSWDHLKTSLSRIGIYAIVFLVLMLGMPFAMGFIAGRATRKPGVVKHPET